MVKNTGVYSGPQYELGILLTRIVAFNFKPETLRDITVSSSVRVLNYRTLNCAYIYIYKINVYMYYRGIESVRISEYICLMRIIPSTHAADENVHFSLTLP